MERLTIGAVANLTGVPTHTLRKWESRHSIVTPNRSESGRRFYTNEHVQRLLLVKRLMAKVTSQRNLRDLITMSWIFWQFVTSRVERQTMTGAPTW